MSQGEGQRERLIKILVPQSSTKKNKFTAFFSLKFFDNFYHLGCMAKLFLVIWLYSPFSLLFKKLNPLGGRKERSETEVGEMLFRK